MISSVLSYRKVRHLLDLSYRNLRGSSLPAARDGWDGWEFYDPDTNESLVVVFCLKECSMKSFSAPVRNGQTDSAFTTMLGEGEVLLRDGELRFTIKGDCLVAHAPAVTVTKGTS